MAITDGLLRYYKLDETSGTTVIDSTGNNNATNTGCTINQTGKIGGCYLAAGGVDYVTFTTPTLGTTISVNIWEKHSTAAGMIFNIPVNSFSQFFNVWLHTSNLVCFNTGDSANNPFKRVSDNVNMPKTDLPLNEWNMITLVVNGSDNTAKLYLNGVYYAYATYKNPTNTSNRNATIFGPTSYRFNGYSDEFGLWNVALTQEDITSLYASGLGKTYPFSYTLTVTEGTGGTVTVNPDQDEYDPDTEVTLTAVPTPKYYVFSDWDGDLTSELSTETITMTSDKSITANFRELKKLRSNSVELGNKTLTQARLSSTTTSTSLTYWLSADGGTNWESVTNNVTHTFTNQGNDLRYEIIDTNENGGTISKIVVSNY